MITVATEFLVGTGRSGRIFRTDSPMYRSCADEQREGVSLHTSPLRLSAADKRVAVLLFCVVYDVPVTRKGSPKANGLLLCALHASSAAATQQVDDDVRESRFGPLQRVRKDDHSIRINEWATEFMVAGD
jgi:hypothetical protein